MGIMFLRCNFIYYSFSKSSIIVTFIKKN